MPPEDRHSGVPGGGGSGADVKSGSVSVADGQTATVTFGTAFASTPHVVVGMASRNNTDDLAQAHNIGMASFQITVGKNHGGGNDTWTVHWIATDAGDP